MRKGSGAAVAVAVAGLAAAGGAGAGTESPGGRIRARLLDDRFLVVPVKVNGSGPHPFLIDTGATSTRIDEALAARLGIAGSTEVAWRTPTGVHRSRLARVSLTMGAVESPDTEALVAPLGSVRDLDPTIRGVVGQNVLRRGNWWLDYRGRSVTADLDGALGDAGLGERLPLRWHADRPVVEARLPDGSALRLVLDSGASSAVLFRNVAARSVGWARLTTHGGEATVRTVTLGPLRLGSTRLPALVAGLFPDAEEKHRAEDGLLPTGLFGGVYFDNREGTVVLNPRRDPPARRLAPAALTGTGRGR
ncbi:MAG TPA: retroviral-like aspartic protease family protein [Vicinamibacteria bacterium]|nr:retroviral-like aspartic protease family protein [Vicinamibacteria bacterium]